MKQYRIMEQKLASISSKLLSFKSEDDLTNRVLSRHLRLLVTEGSSEYSDSDLDMSRRRSRRSHKKAVNYCETSESEGSQAGTNRSKMKMKPRQRHESSESEGQSEADITAAVCCSHLY